jgi:hypothetical protein
VTNISWLNTNETAGVSGLHVSGSAFGTVACAFAGQPMRKRHVDAYTKATSGRRTWSPPIT